MAWCAGAGGMVCGRMPGAGTPGALATVPLAAIARCRRCVQVPAACLSLTVSRIPKPCKCLMRLGSFKGHTAPE